jgi:signal transduction histidine kinase/CheY-like chemotaxis protein
VSERHSLLRRQLKRFSEPSLHLEALLEAVDSAYREFDADRSMLERSLELSSQELLTANADMRAIFGAIPDIFVRVDESGRIVDFKAGERADYFVPPHKLIGKRVQDVPSSETGRRLAEALAEVQATKKPTTIEYSLWVQSAESFYEARFLPLRTPEVVVMIRNITELKRMQARLIFADRMASVGTLAAGVAHEVNNPLTYAILNLHDAERELASVQPADLALAKKLESIGELLKEAEDGAERVNQIVRDLQTFSKSEDDRKDKVDVRSALDAAVKLARADINARAKLVKAYAEDVQPVIANVGRLGQVFLNVLINALQAIPEGEAENNEIRISTRSDDRMRAVIEVTDTGCGIQPEDLGRIFDPFFTTKRGGTGLGLAICHGIVTGLGGEMSVTSSPGQGATITIILPTEKTEENSGASLVPTPPPERQRILIIDDEVKIGIALARALEQEHDVVSLTSAIEALERLVAGERFDLILCDLMMPSMSGMDFYARLETDAPAQVSRVVFTTGVAFTPKLRAFLDRIPNPRLGKPIEIGRLRALIKARRGRG